MDMYARIESLMQASQELASDHVALTHRIDALARGVDELEVLRVQLHDAKAREQAARTVLQQIRERLPVVARKESLARVHERLDHEPFETYVRSATLQERP